MGAVWLVPGGLFIGYSSGCLLRTQRIEAQPQVLRWFLGRESGSLRFLSTVWYTHIITHVLRSAGLPEGRERVQAGLMQTVAVGVDATMPS